MIEPNELVEFSSQVPGIIEQINVERGDRVQRGQVLTQLKSGVEEAAVNLAKARVEFGLRKAERNEELYKKQLISSHEKDEIETEIQLAQLQLLETEERLKLRTIRSTIDGVV
ncbi:MAG: biotin/lipoyl-binding protein, partial [Desulfuromonadales bacterium]|nr:biotin/lipoyl-binding protein [Desulfuromonadales bacterium]